MKNLTFIFSLLLTPERLLSQGACKEQLGKMGRQVGTGVSFEKRRWDLELPISHQISGQGLCLPTGLVPD